MIYQLWTDGSAMPFGKTFVGGWAYCLVLGSRELTRRAGSDPDTTINRMELTAVIEALEDGTVGELTFAGHRVEVFSDSRYVVDGANAWTKDWVQNGWKTAAGKPVKNADLWQRLLAQSSDKVDFYWVKGHSGDAFNEEMDRLSRRTCQFVLDSLRAFSG